MILQEPDQTQFDLRFSLFGIPVRVHPLFWLVTVILGFNALQDNPGIEGFRNLLFWVVCVFVSILVHELGHVCMGLFFGSRGHIVLWSLGGLAVGSSSLESWLQRIAVYFAGPLAGFLFLGAILAGVGAYDFDTVLTLMRVTLHLGRGPGVDPDIPWWCILILLDLISINLMWGLVNLLPIHPLDGGQISREVCVRYIRENALRIALIISIAVAGSLAACSLIGMIRKEPLLVFLPADLFGVLFFGFLALGSWQVLQQTPTSGGGRMDDDRYDRAPWERDPDWWKRG